MRIIQNNMIDNIQTGEKHSNKTAKRTESDQEITTKKKNKSHIKQKPTIGLQ